MPRIALFQTELLGFDTKLGASEPLLLVLARMTPGTRFTAMVWNAETLNLMRNQVFAYLTN